MTVHKISLRECVAMTLQPDIQSKKVAEKKLDEMSSTPGFLDALLEMSSSDKEGSIRMVSAVCFRRYLERFWTVPGFAKAEIIGHFPSFLLSASKESERQLISTLGFILKTDEIETWQGLVGASEKMIQSNDLKMKAVGLKMFNKVVVTMVDEYKSEEMLEAILDRIGSSILDLIVLLVQSEMDTCALGMKVLAHSCESYVLPNAFKTPMFIQGVISIFLATSDASIENDSLVKWSFVLMNNLLRKTKKKKDVPSFAIFSEKDILHALYKRASETLYQCKAGRRSQKIEKQALLLIKHIISKSNIGWEIIKNDVPAVITIFVLPAVSFTEDLEDSWESSQVDFMREQEARYSYSAGTISSELFFDLVKLCKDQPDVINWIVSIIMKEISVYSSNPTEETAKIRYGGLSLFKTVAKHIKNNKEVFDTLMNDLRSPHAIVKYMAFSALQNFSYYKAISVEVLDPFLQAVSSNDIAVVVESILCLPHMLEVEEIKKRLEPNIPQFIKLILDLTNKIQIESLSTTLEDVIVLCTDQAISIAPGIAEAVSGSILHLLNQEEEEEEMMEEKFDVINGYIRIIITLMESLDKSPEAVIRIVDIAKVMIVTVAKNHPENLPDLFPLISCASYASKNVDSMYDILEEILNIPAEDLIVYLSDVSGILDNFITYGKAGMLKYLGTIFGILNGLFKGECMTEYDFPYACRIFESIILNLSSFLGDKLVDLLRTSMSMVFGNKDLLNDAHSVVSAAEVFLCAFIASPADTIAIAVSINEFEFIVKGISTNYKKFERVHDLKLLLLFSGMLLTQPIDAIPAGISPDLLMSLFTHTLIAFPEALAYRESLRTGVTDYENDDYYDRDYFGEDPTFETPLDVIDPYEYARGILNSPQESAILTLWGKLPEKVQGQVIRIVQTKQ